MARFKFDKIYYIHDEYNEKIIQLRPVESLWVMRGEDTAPYIMRKDCTQTYLVSDLHPTRAAVRKAVNAYLADIKRKTLESLN